MGKIAVFSERSNLWSELIQGARELGQEVKLVVIGSKEQAAKGAALGADVYYLGEKGPNMVEDYALTIAELVKTEGIEGLLIGATVRGRAIAGKIAARLGITAFADAKKLENTGGSIETSHLVYGGSAIRINKSKADYWLALVGTGVFEATEELGVPGQIKEIPFQAPTAVVKVTATVAKPPVSVDLSTAQRVVGIGLGLGKKEDLSLIEDLAKAVDGEVGCTRPVAESLGWLPNERYIGISGAIIKPEVYFAVGISGQVQHVVGINESKVVVAVNKDKNAPVIKQADYTIVGDLYDVVPELIKGFQARK
jgi:electron transfer flavoprotein alpha subunit